MKPEEQKKRLRKQISAEKKKYSKEEKLKLSKVIWNRIELFPSFQKSQTLLVYHSLPDEVDTHEFIEKWSNQKQILLPVVKGDRLVLRSYDKRNLASGVFGIQEPTGENFTDWDKIDFIIVPAVAYDKRGNRLGRGGGYYDRLLPQLKGLKVGVCFPFQHVEQLPVEDFDIQVDLVVFD